MTAPPPPARADDALALSRRSVRELLSGSAAFQALAPDVQRSIAHDTVQVAHYLAEPEGIRAAAAPVAGMEPLAQAQAAATPPGPPDFKAGAAREGAAAAGALLQAVNFPSFVTGLISGVFHSIVTSTIEQMEAYGKLVADVAKSLNEFRDENVSVNQARDQLVDSYPDVFRLSIETGEDGTQSPRVRLHDGVDEDTAIAQLKGLPLDKPLTSLDDDVTEAQLVPAVRTQMATGRQQLLATMVMMGIQRIVVTDGKIQAKVLYDFQARDNTKYTYGATQFDYDPTLKRTMTDESFDHGSIPAAVSADEVTRRDGSWYAKGRHREAQEPVLNLQSTLSQSGDSSLTTKASLAGIVDINFKSDYLPLEKMVDPAQIAQLQLAAQPARTPTAIGQPAATPAPAPPATPPAR